MINRDEKGLYFLLNETKVYHFTEHFKVSEMFATDQKEFADINYKNVKSDVIFNLHILCFALELIRSFLGSTPIHINSGYRCPALNAKVGGVYTSYHLTGHAADLSISDHGEALRSFLKQLQELHILNEVIYYKNFIHVSIPTFNSPNYIKESIYKKFSHGKN